MSKAKRVLCITVTVLLSVLVLSWNISRFLPKLTTMTIVKLASTNRDTISDVTSVESTRWTPYMDMLDASILKEPPLENIKSIASVKNSSIRIVDEKSFYNVGDEIRIDIQLYDGLGRRRVVGGDKLVVRIFEDSLKAGASGYVLDHRNGTYTAVLKCLWPGQPSIDVYIDLTRETVRMLLKYLEKNGAAVVFYIKYKNREVQECQPFTRWFSASTDICNMTERNGGMSWFCKAPRSNKTTCKDVFKFEGRLEFRDLSTTPAEKSLNRQIPMHFPLMKINVQDDLKSSFKQSIKPPCSTYNRTKLWFLPSPVGHFFQDKWIPKHCTMPSPDKFAKCLANRRIILYGDSTIFQWHGKLCKMYKCKGCKRPPGWKVDITSYCENINLTIDWVGHSLPGNMYRNFSNSPASHIFKYQKQKNIIFVIHMYAHLFRYHSSIFRDRIRRVRKGIEAFVKVNPDAVFLFKGPNSFQPGEILRYEEYAFRVFLLEEFKGLYDKVIYLDQRDVHIARKETKVHPNGVIVTYMVNQMLAYICN